MAPLDSAALLRKRRRLLDQTRVTTGDQLGRIWDSLDYYGDEQPFTKLAAPIVEAGQRRAVSLQIASLQAILGVRLGFDLPALLDRATIDLNQPFIAFANALSNGLDITDAVQSGRERAAGVGESAVTFAARAANTTADRHVSGWERVPEGGACDWCIEVAGQTYHTAESASFGHLRCACDVIPAA